MLSPEFFTDPKILKLQPVERLLFAGLWCHADRCGVLPDDPEHLSISILPRDPGVDCDEAIRRMAALGLLLRYEVQGRKFIHVTNFLRWQQPHQREVASGYPLPSGLNQAQAYPEHNLGSAQHTSYGYGYGDGDGDGITTPDKSGPVERVFAHWRTVLEHPKATLDPKRRRILVAALRLKPEADCLRVIDGCRASAYHMGENEKRTRYDSIGLLFRDADHMERFVGYAEKKRPTLRSVGGAGRRADGSDTDVFAPF